MRSGGSLQHSQQSATCPYPEPDQSSPCPHLTSWKSVLMLSSHLRLGLPSVLFPSGCPTKTLYTSALSPPHSCYMPSPSHSSRFDHPNNIWREGQLIKLHSPVTSSLVGPNTFISLFSNILCLLSYSVWKTQFHTPTKRRFILTVY